MQGFQRAGQATAACPGLMVTLCWLAAPKVLAGDSCQWPTCPCPGTTRRFARPATTPAPTDAGSSAATRRVPFRRGRQHRSPGWDERLCDAGGCRYQEHRHCALAAITRVLHRLAGWLGGVAVAIRRRRPALFGRPAAFTLKRSAGHAGQDGFLTYGASSLNRRASQRHPIRRLELETGRASFGDMGAARRLGGGIRSRCGTPTTADQCALSRWWATDAAAWHGV